MTEYVTGGLNGLEEAECLCPVKLNLGAHEDGEVKGKVSMRTAIWKNAQLDADSYRQRSVCMPNRDLVYLLNRSRC